MSYVNRNIRVFKEAGDIEIEPKRSDGRMKTYTSATDARAWCDINEDRRQHILKLIRQGSAKGLSLGKYIPIEVIIDILLANKDAEIKRLLAEIEELKKFLKANGLHYGPGGESRAVPVGELIGKEKVSGLGSGVAARAFGLDDGGTGAGGAGAGGAGAGGLGAEGVGVEGFGPREKEALLKRIAELEGENSGCKCKIRELEICKFESNCLKKRVSDLSKVQQDYEDLLKKTQSFDALKAEWAMYKCKYEELKDLESECNELRAKVQKCEELENEKRILLKEIEDCECCMNHQEDEIKGLACHIDCLNQDLDKRQLPNLLPPCMPPVQRNPCTCLPPITIGQAGQMIPYSPTFAWQNEKISSIKEIAELENKMLMKQENTKTKINVLQSTVDKFKRELELERQRNNDLVSRYTNQSKTVENMKVEMNIVKRENFQDKKKLQQLNMTLKNVLGAPSPPLRCRPPNTSTMKPTGLPHIHSELPQIHTELTMVRNNSDSKFKHDCVMKRGCSCHPSDKSSDSFDIDE